MPTTRSTSRGIRETAVRGVTALAGTGAALGAITAALASSPAAAFFGAGQGALAGAAAGLVDAAVLWWLASRSASAWQLRIASGLVVGVAVAAGFGAAPGAWGQVWLVLGLAPVLVGGALGATIATGRARRIGTSPGPVTHALALPATVLGWCAAVGAGLGAVAGLVLGLSAYPPTAWFAVLEGAAFGVVGGAGVGLVAAGVVLAVTAWTRG